MNQKAIKWLYQEIPELVAKGILTQEAAGKIREYYGEIKTTGKRSITLIICGTAGALLIGLGIILLLAYNWEQFSRLTRAILSFAPLIIGQALALWVLLKRPQSTAFKEGTATFLSLMVGASIALISQTYNIPGEMGTFILTWMLLILPLVYLMQASLPAAIYLIGITSWAGSSWDNPLKTILFWPLAFMIAPHFIWALRREIYAIRATILSLIMAICVSCATGFSLGKTWPGAWVILFPTIFAIFYYLGSRKFIGLTSNWQRPLRVISGIGLFVLALQYTFRYIWQYLIAEHESYGFTTIQINDMRALPDHIITLILIAIAILFFYDTVKRKNLILSLFLVVPLLSILAYLLRKESVIIPLLIFNIYVFVLSISRIMQGIRSNNLAVVNTGMLLLAILIVARFFDSDISFIIKGLVFIAVGIGFLATNLFLMRRKEVLNEK
ncbi:MAG: DUF2157 domain-containing protein [Candidatus Omnitrophica bacterium]|nr:DUF2157 domain-containing protein [Candidatus Omnitrophota bacterium]